MSVLFAGLDHSLALITARRLIEQGDEVRVLLTEERFADAYRAVGVFVALGSELGDPDLVERACQNVRTLVLGPISKEVLEHMLMGTAPAGVGRLVYVTERPGSELGVIERASHSYVVLRCPRPGLLGRNRLDPATLAEAIDAADDLDGEPRLDLDLGTDAAWAELKLPTPG